VTDNWIKLGVVELHNLYSLVNIIKAIKSRIFKIGWACSASKELAGRCEQITLKM
jgi:hypothetical protein